MFLPIFLCSCSNDPQKNYKEIAETQTPNDDINIIDVSGQGELKKNNELISFQIINVSGEKIVFPSDYDVKLMVLRNDTWEQINNCFHYAEVERTLPAEDGPQLGLVFSVFPCMDEINENLPLRVWVSGNKENKTEEKVTAYIEMQLLP
jgi:hypothetical protein